MTFSEDNTDKAVSYWRRQEELHRCILEQKISVSDYKRDRDQLEKSLMKEVQSNNFDTTDSNQLSDIMTYALNEERRLQDYYLTRQRAASRYLREICILIITGKR